MTITSAVLKIPGDRTSATIAAEDGSVIHFAGDENQALRISFCVPRLLGGNMYTVSKGELFERGGLMCFKIKDGAGLDNDVEIEFNEESVHRVSIVWT